jgi:hypothetical protein
MIRINRWIDFAHDGPPDLVLTRIEHSLALWQVRGGRACRSDAGQNARNLCRAACNSEFRLGQRRQIFIAVIVAE